MLLNNYLGSLRVRRRETAWATTWSDQLETVRLDLPAPAARPASPRARPSVSAALAGLVNLASVRRSAGAPAASGQADIPVGLRALVRAGRSTR